MTLCIYHGNCADGFGAAWAVRQAIPAADFFPATYQDPPPDVTGKDVVMVDFSYKRPLLLDMASVAKSILILDHHKSAAEDLIDLPGNVTAVFDMERSGARMAWDHFFPDAEPPKLIEHIEDRDLWRFALPGTREIQANVFSHPYDFDVWDELMATEPDKLRLEGAAIERKHHKDIRELLKVTQRRMVIGGFDVPVANLPYTLSSDAGHEMAKGEPFAACYWDVPDGRVFSLRSAPDGQDVSAIAKQYGGGGHHAAAGFKVPTTHALGSNDHVMPDKYEELRHVIKCAEISLEGKRDRIAELERILTDWLDAYDTPDQWMRCRNNAKIALGRDADPKAYLWA